MELLYWLEFAATALTLMEANRARGERPGYRIPAGPRPAHARPAITRAQKNAFRRRAPVPERALTPVPLDLQRRGKPTPIPPLTQAPRGALNAPAWCAGGPSAPHSAPGLVPPPRPRAKCVVFSAPLRPPRAGPVRGLGEVMKGVAIPANPCAQRAYHAAAEGLLRNKGRGGFWKRVISVIRRCGGAGGRVFWGFQDYKRE